MAEAATSPTMAIANKVKATVAFVVAAISLTQLERLREEGNERELNVELIASYIRERV
jgi:hypothetical protein